MLQDRKLLNRDKIEFEANQKLIDLENIVQALRNNRLSVLLEQVFPLSQGM